MAYLISEQEFLEYNGIDQSLDSGIFTPGIEKAQEKYIYDLLGSTLYDEIVIQSASSSLTSQNSILLNNYIKPTLALFAYYEALPKIVYRVDGNGVFKKSGEFLDSIDRNELISIRQIALDDAEIKATKLTRHLCLNESLYPSYNLKVNNDDIYAKHGKQYTSSIYLGKRIRR